MEENSNEPIQTVEQTKEKVGQDQIHSLLFGEQLSWQSIILDLINSEQLDPWDIDIALLTNKYLETIKNMEEANLFVSSKVLFAASLLVRIKSEILLNHYLPSLDDILFGRKEEKKYKQERLELDEEVPELVQRTPLPRYRKVSLEELMAALGKAFKTENRRIQKVVTAKQQEIETAISIPKGRINLKDKISEVYNKVKNIFSKKEDKIAFTDLLYKNDNEERVATFIPLLHLDNQHKVFLEQENHFEEIYVWMKHHHMKTFAAQFEDMQRDAEAAAIKMQAEEEQLEKEEAERAKHEKKKHRFKKKDKEIQKESKEIPEETIDESQ